ncbi:MAG: hypothetical protein DRJ42_23490 [Deltaproteobacteria bacterium]|nr:MAG: hypothetical protein DRJ42_23490 [Deltaproteobacteria bacterium]
MVILGPLRGLDAVRGRVLAATGLWVRPLLRDRGLRVSVVASIGIGFAFAATVLAPRLLLLYGPLILGVPHLLADVRYLIVQPGAHRAPGFRWVVLPLLAGLWLWPSLYLGIASVGAAAMVAPAIGAGAWRRRGVVLAACAAITLVVAYDETASRLAFAHLHNLIAVVFVALLAVRREHLRRGVVPLALFVTAGVALLFGTLEPLTEGALARASRDPSFRELAWGLAPGEDQAVALRIVLFYAFAQSVHYASWLRVIPEQARTRRGVRGFVSSYRALEEELGAPTLLVAAAVMGGLLLWAAVDSWGSRDGYLRLAFFHGPLELAMLAWLFVRGTWLPLEGAPP